MTNALKAFNQYLWERLRMGPLLAGFFYQILREGWRDRKEGRQVYRENFLRQILFTGVEAAPFVLLVALITGAGAVIMILVTLSIIRDPDTIGNLLTSIFIQELGPLMTAMIVILRSGTAIAVELGYMRVLGEMDALDMMGISHFRFIILPRAIGVTAAVLCLFLYFDVMAIFGGYGLARLVAPVRMGWNDYLDLYGRALDLADVLIGVVKALLFGGAISLASMWQGYHVRASIIEVPQAASKAAINSLFFCLFFNFFVSLLFAWVA